MLKKWLFLLVILVVLGIFATFVIFDAKDHCLDYGGRYNDNTQQCEQ
ncbi:hypothetical protein [Histophilus somni]|uniref:Uncharacterized protein n=1 Tax=Histophilus somni TaxID=731 RepID=A0A9Q6Z179_HISSO|nr:hypothetical protein [Histophilus somni]MBB5151989.1 hypothetical protein [Histophilus somni]QQF76413.1 hypothetical protein JFL52_06015 [Histophilus somni]QQF83083.1 hypothetical protein JFL49_04060 [Histophilus somni]QQF90308.1 hypothetical protein JFL57_06010 [Histophilus somni]